MMWCATLQLCETCRSSADVVEINSLLPESVPEVCLFPRLCKLGLHRYSSVVISEIWSETLGSCVAMKTTWCVCGDCRSQLSAGEVDAGVSLDRRPGLSYNQPFCGLPPTFQFMAQRIPPLAPQMMDRGEVGRQGGLDATQRPVL